MNKELEALKTIKIKCHPNSNPSPLVDDALEVVEQALIKAQKQEKENVDYGSARERWKIICQMIKRMFGFDIEEKWSEDNKVITQALIKAQEQEKVLEIILKKRVDIASFKAIVAVHPKKAKEYYNESMGFNTRRILKQEEFDLLKRYFYE